MRYANGRRPAVVPLNTAIYMEGTGRYSEVSDSVPLASNYQNISSTSWK